MYLFLIFAWEGWRSSALAKAFCFHHKRNVFTTKCRFHAIDINHLVTMPKEIGNRYTHIVIETSTKLFVCGSYRCASILWDCFCQQNNCCDYIRQVDEADYGNRCLIDSCKRSSWQFGSGMDRQFLWVSHSYWETIDMVQQLEPLFVF